MSDTGDQNTPKDDFSQSIDDISTEAGEAAEDSVQSPDINEENTTPTDAFEAAEHSSDGSSTAEDGISGPSGAGNGGIKYDLSTLTGRLEKKIAEVKSILWEKEALQMQFVFQGGRIREEYYKLWKGEANIFVVMASRLQKRLDKERQRTGQV